MLKAIVGAGIGGCALSYFLHETFGDHVELVVYEKNSSPGGRIDCFEYNERKYEYGATILHSSNRYMKTFARNICGTRYKT